MALLLIVGIIIASFTACSNSGITVEEYERAVSENNALKNQLVENTEPTVTTTTQATTTTPRVTELPVTPEPEPIEIVVTVSNETELRAAIGQAELLKPTTVVFTSDIEIISNFSIPARAIIKLTSEDESAFSLIATRDMDVITVESRATLTIGNITITRVSGTTGSGVIVERDSTLTMDSGTITGHVGLESDRSGGVDSYGTFIMNGGTIKGNTAGGFWVHGDVHVAGDVYNEQWHYWWRYRRRI
jgi:hypothetical protein